MAKTLGQLFASVVELAESSVAPGAREAWQEFADAIDGVTYARRPIVVCDPVPAPPAPAGEQLECEQLECEILDAHGRAVGTTTAVFKRR